tara:strand:+ start:316 stop:732 length:417 start_codon:yes stop_codon:yes gene_type:complete
MAFYRGEEGSVKFDDAGSSNSAITSTRSWSLTLDKEVLSTTVMGDTYGGNVGGIIQGSGSVEVIYTASSSDETAAFIDHINTATDEGTASFELFLDTSGDKKISFDGVVTSADLSATVGEIEIITVNFTTNGAITTAI